MQTNSTQTNRPSKRNRKTYGLILFAVCLTVLLLGSELLVRLLSPLPGPITWIRSDDQYAYVNKENTQAKYSFAKSDFVMEVNINSMGLRDRELADEMFREGSNRILAIGDSGTFGFGVNIEDRFSTKLEKLLNISGHPYYVINTGVCGWGTIQETKFARDHFDEFQPDIVLLTFVGNDPRNDEKFRLGLKDAAKGLVSFPGKDFLRRNSHLYRFIATYLQPVLYNLIKLRVAPDKVTKNFDKESAVFISQSNWNNSLEVIRQFHNDFLQYNPEGILIIQSSSVENEEVHKQMSTLDNGGNLIYVNLSEDAKSVNSIRLAYDGHWSRAMHTASAKRLSHTIENIINNKKLSGD